ncbi:MAG TPA: hypothetical protein VFT22_24440 [Kofleriaceae bacterium]|nr:hypothetical protein [Kofleriaceae bacterium]
MSKRSPILGYNHNVRYRGLVFHVQTEDSGVASPHLFTHLFHSGVIVSTRKLVYDAGSAEESIKSLMQAQHKATLKDLRRGHFDDKIDSYLGGTPGLLPRGAEEPVERLSEAELAPTQGTVEEVAVGAPTEQVAPMAFDEASVPVPIIDKAPLPSRPVIPPPIPRALTAERPLSMPPRATPPSLDATLRTAAPAFDPSPEEIDLSPEIEIQLELDDHDDMATRRTTRDTELHVAFNEQIRATSELDEHTRPTLGSVSAQARRAASISDGIPGPIRPSSPSIPPPPPDSRRLGDRPSTINAATLPPARPISRPASRTALSQPQAARPAPSDDRSRRDSEGSAVIPSAEPPGGSASQYAQHRKSSTRIPIEGVKPERSGNMSVPAGLGRPQRIGQSPSGPTVKPGVTPAPGVASASAAPGASSAGVASASAAPGASPAPGVASASAAPGAIPHEASSRSSGHTEPLRGRAPTPSRTSPSGPVASGGVRAGSSGGSGVVMSRPAVIVGAPAKSVGTVPRIRKAREDEGRGFGQGLISEKSLDEVILAYLSEDADEK